MAEKHRYRHHYHEYLRRLVEESGDSELKKAFYALEKQIDAGKFYPPRIQKVRDDIRQRVKEGKPPMSIKGLRLLQEQIEEENGLTKKLKEI